MANLDAAQILAISQGHFAAGALKAALDLEIFTHIAHGTATAAQLAAAKKTPLRSMRLLCDALVGLGLVEYDGDKLSLPEAAARMLVKGAPGYIGNQIGISHAPWFWEGAQNLVEIVKTGHPLLGPNSAEARELPFWEEFQRYSRQAAASGGAALAEAIAVVSGEPGPQRILDIACGSGMYGFSLLKRFPQAHLVLNDYANVLRLTEADAERIGLRERCEFRPGDLFADDLGSGYDLVLAVNIFQIYGPAKIEQLARRLHQAMAPGGMLVVCGPIPDEERRANRFALMFGMNMLIFTQEGDIYTFSEYQRMLTAAGFRDLTAREVAGPRPMQAIIAHK
jgi:trans-aconitate methyltransferase